MDCALEKVSSGTLPDVIAQRFHESFIIAFFMDRFLYGTENDFKIISEQTKM